jgi:hypothetical protein
MAEKETTVKFIGVIRKKAKDPHNGLAKAITSVQ